MPTIYFENMLPRLDPPKPTPAKYARAEWWKNMNKFVSDEPDLKCPVPHHPINLRSGGKIGTMRKCPAVEDAMHAGYTLYFPADTYFDATGERVIMEHMNFLGKEADVEHLKYGLAQNIEAAKGYQSAFDFHEQLLKLNTYWGIRTPKGYSSLITHPLGRTDLPFYMVDAIVDTDEYTAMSPYSFFIKKGFKGTIKRGTPMMQVIPFKREDEWTIEITDVDKERFLRKATLMDTVFDNAYKKFFWTRKKFN